MSNRLSGKDAGVANVGQLDKRQSQLRPRLYYVRVETDQNQPLLEKRSCAELVITYLFNFQKQQWIDLMGFVVMPNEVQLITVPRILTVNALIENLDEATTPLLTSVIPHPAPIWDTEVYFELIDGIEEARRRMNTMHATPIRQHLASSATQYDFSSANSRYAENLVSLEQFFGR